MTSSNHRAALRVRLIQSSSELADAETSWTRLHETAPLSDFFGGPQWVIPWVSAYWSGDRLAIAFVHRDDGLVGVVPLLRSTAGSGPCRQAFTTLMNPHIRQTGIVSCVDPAETLGAVLREAASSGERGCVALHQVLTGSALDLAVTRACDDLRFLEIVESRTAGAVADLSAGWEAYVATRKSQVSREMRRKEKKIVSADGWTFRRFCAPGEREEAVRAIVRIEERSWKHARGSAIGNEPGALAFYTGVIERSAAAGWLCVHVLYQHDEPVAHVLGIVHRQVFHALKTAYDNETRNWSPGAVLMWRAMREAAEEGCTRFDFLGDAAGWKEDLATSLPEYASRYVFARNQWGCRARRFAETTLKPIGRRAGLDRLKRVLQARASNGAPAAGAPSNGA